MVHRNLIIFIFFLFLSYDCLYLRAATYSIDQICNLGLSVIVINTEGGIEPSCDTISPPRDAIGHGITNATKVPGRMLKYTDGKLVFDSGDYLPGESGMTIKIRGNTSAWHDKKPYKIKLQKKADLLLRGEQYKDKDWLLIKDDSLRALAGFKLNELIGMNWTPKFEYVNVIVNDDYKGVYMLVESVKRNNKCRVTVDDSGYIFEFDAYWWNEDFYITSPSYLWTMMHYTFKYPDIDTFSDDRIEEFEKIICDFENSLFDGSYPQYLDTDSFAKWLLGQDILGNGDPCGSNIFLIKRDNTESTKIEMGCLWDFDRIMEMPGEWSREHSRGVFCYGPLINSDNKKFIEEYYSCWERMSTYVFSNMIEFLQSFSNSAISESLNSSFELDGKKWAVEHRSVIDCIHELDAWFKDREKWLSSIMISIIKPSLNMSFKTIEQKENSFFYDLNGNKRYSKPQGIYIRNGSKFIN